MADGTKIEWTDATANVINGCSLESPGCTNCYAMKQAHRTEVRRGLTQMTKGGMVWTGEVRFHEPALLKVLSWQRPRKIFWNAHGDIFHPSVPDEWIDRCFAVMALTPQHVHQVLTKRSARMLEYMPAIGGGDTERWARALQPLAGMVGSFDLGDALEFVSRRGPLRNVWLGVSVEDQKRADERREHLKATPAAIRYVSYEPALEVVDWTGWEFIDWLISGGESGNNARYIDYVAFHKARDWCARSHVAFLHKQNGVFDEQGVKIGKHEAGRLLDGVQHDGFPGASHA